MKTYDYLENVKEDVRNYIEENKIVVTSSNREEVEQELNDTLFVNDSVTGNASGSYTFSTWQAEENLCHNFELLTEALTEIGCDLSYLEKGAEACDVTIRCYLLGQAISEVLDEVEEEMEGKILSGYYTESAIQERQEAKRIAEIEKRKNEVIKTFEKRINKATKEKDVKLAILGAGLLSDNYIYYVEGNNVVFNYYSYHDKVTEEEYNNMLKNIDYSLLPEGIKFEFK